MSQQIPPNNQPQKPLTLADIVNLKQANINQRMAMIDTLKKLEMEDAQLTQALINLVGQKPLNRAERRRLEQAAQKEKPKKK